MILIPILLILLIVLFILSVWFRSRITDLAGTAVDYTVGTWYRIWPAVRTALIIGGIGWGILVTLMIGFGIYANSFWSALIISIFFPLWFLSMLIPRRIDPSPIKWRIPIFGIVRFFGGIVLFFTSLLLAFGIWSPGVKDALNERHGDIKVTTENSLRKGHTQSERNVGIRGWIISDTHLYDNTDEVIETLRKEEEIYVFDIKGGRPATDNREAVLPAMLKNEDGDFFRGKKGWVPAMKISWEKPKVKAEVGVETLLAKNPAASVASSESWKLCWQKPEGYVGTTQTKSRCDAVKVEFLEQGFRLKGTAQNFSFVGERVEENSYQGKWKNATGEEGDIFLKFSPDFKLATGWQKDQGSQEEIYTWLG